MKRYAILPSFVALVAALASPAAHAQYGVAGPVPKPAPLSDADALAAQMRIIAAEPSDVGALAQAGELSARLGDLSGASSLFARANKVDPRNGRVKAGMAEVLLRSERPGEALRFFDQAEGYGYPATRFGAERGLAYDLVGQQGRAQRDYRQVLTSGESAEVRRRYALSLGISGQREAALKQLEPLIQRNDRGAWRSRAFILAMQGDVAAATTIATTMMAPGQAQGLAPFFARLASLGPVERAFAVHFGELRPTAQRLADSRLAPALSPLAPEIVQVARAVPVAASPPTRTADRHRRPRKGEVQLAALIPLPAPMARPPAYGTATVTVPASPRVATTFVPFAPAAARPGQAALVAAERPSSRTEGDKATYFVPGSLLPHYPPRPSSSPVAVPGRSDIPRPAATVAAPANVRLVGSTPAPAQALVSSVAVQQRRSVTIAAAPPVTAAVPVAQVPIAPVTVTATALPVLPSGVFVPVSGGLKPLALTASSLPATSLATVMPPTPPAARATMLPAVTPAGPPPPMPLVPLAVITAPGATLATPPVAGAAAVREVPGGNTDAILARIAGALAMPSRELATAVPADPIGKAEPAQATPAPAKTPAAPTPVSGFPDAPLVINGQLTEAGKAITSRHPRTPDRVVTTPVTMPAPADVGAKSERSARSASRESDSGASDHPRSRSARHDPAVTDTAEPAPAHPRRQRGTDRAAAEEAAADTPPPLDRKAAARKAAADRKALADKKAAAEAKSQADKDAAEERKARKSEPERYWVQVAGGANGGDLSKAWSSMRAKAPALAGRKGWSTPLRATNRVVTGPFKTDEEARAFVNTLKKQGVSAFPFTSEAGQKITRLDAK